ncbi:MAG: CRISPR-associated endoribonuclease Cas6 [Acidobacteria bacterium]|nr:CRISPR-associated endoribonuclease Cas6 [Acidobacteriota bacterium]
MRIRISLAAEKYPASIPLNHHILAGFIYETISLVSPKLATLLHNEGLRSGFANETDKSFKFFVFALPELPNYYFSGEYKCFDQGLVYWQISSPVSDIIDSIVASLAINSSVRIGRSLFSVTDIEFIPTPIFTQEMRFIALSPLTVSTSWQDIDRKRVKYYLRANEKEFGELVVSNLLAKYYALNGKKVDDSQLHFEFDEDYIRSVGGFDSKKITRLIRYGNTEIKSVFAPFIVRGNPELIWLGWESGFGNSNSQGFGMAGIS